jgi:broad specificity phosphatase PhoE
MYQHRIALIRHGQTEWSASGQHTSTTDIDLTDEGVHQAMTIPSLLWGLGLVPMTVWSSPRLRAQRTATLAGLQIDEIVDDLAEWSYGEYEGITSKQIRVGNPSWSVFTQGAPGGESPEEVAARADRVLSRARVALEHGDVALVGHGHMSRALAVRWVGLPIAAGGLILMNPAAITVLGTYHEKPCIEHANVVPFKPPALKPSSSTATGQHRTVPSGATGNLEPGHA